VEADIGAELGVQDIYLGSSACEKKEEEAGLDGWRGGPTKPCSSWQRALK